MCGIVGIVGKYESGLTYSEGEMFQTMLFLDTLRGWDSTGIFGVNKLGNVEIHKAALHGADFICSKEFKTFKDAAMKDGRFVIGHNRAATKGSISDENAHPFYVDDKIVLVQNGTFRGDHKKLKDVDVDSHALAHVLSEEPDIEKALRKIDAAYALVWYNTELETLNLIRNSERPLWIAEFEDNGFMFASERETIMYAVFKSSVIQKFKQEPYLLPEYELLTVSGVDSKLEITKRKLDCEVPIALLDYSGVNWRKAFRDTEDHVNVDRENYNNDKGKISLTINTIVANLIDGEDEFYFPSLVSATECADWVNKIKDPHGIAFIQVHDFYHANESKDCTTYHVIAKIYDRTTKPVSALVHWILFNQRNVSDVRGMVGKVYTAKLNDLHVSQLRNRKDQNVYVVRMFATMLEEIKIN